MSSAGAAEGRLGIALPLHAVQAGERGVRRFVVGRQQRPHARVIGRKNRYSPIIATRAVATMAAERIAADFNAGGSDAAAVLEQ